MKSLPLLRTFTVAPPASPSLACVTPAQLAPMLLEFSKQCLCLDIGWAPSLLCPSLLCSAFCFVFLSSYLCPPDPRHSAYLLIVYSPSQIWAPWEWVVLSTANSWHKPTPEMQKVWKISWFDGRRNILEASQWLPKEGTSAILVDITSSSCLSWTSPHLLPSL